MSKAKFYSTLFTEEEFKQGAKTSRVVCKTEKGLQFLNK